jgi:hypothetical protein
VEEAEAAAATAEAFFERPEDSERAETEDEAEQESASAEQK